MTPDERRNRRRECCRSQYVKNHEARLKYARQYRQRKIREDKVAWVEKRRRHKSENYYRAKEAIFRKLGRECKMCGFSDVRALCIDHVRGAGNRERWFGKIKYEEHLKRVLEDKTGKYQILCHNCNWIKRRENPHERGGSRSGELSAAIYRQEVELLEKKVA